MVRAGAARRSVCCQLTRAHCHLVAHRRRADGRSTPPTASAGTLQFAPAPAIRAAVFALTCFTAPSGAELAVTGDAAGQLVLWALRRGRAPAPVAATRPPGGPVFSLSVCGATLLAGTAAREVVALPLASIEAAQLALPETRYDRMCGGHTGWVRALAVATPDSATMTPVFFSCGCNHVRAWQLSVAAAGTGAQARLLSQSSLFTGDVTCLAATDDGAVLSAGADGSVRRWELADGRLQAGPDMAVGAGASSTGRRVQALLALPRATEAGGAVVSGDRSGGLTARDARTGRLLASARTGAPICALSAVPAAAASSGRSLVSGGADGVVSAWSFDAARGTLRCLWARRADGTEAAGADGGGAAVRALHLLRASGDAVRPLLVVATAAGDVHSWPLPC